MDTSSHGRKKISLSLTLCMLVKENLQFFFSEFRQILYNKWISFIMSVFSFYYFCFIFAKICILCL